MATDTPPADWETYSEMRPRLRPHVGIDRQHFRGERWYVLQNTANGRFHRLSPAAYELVGRFDGQSTLAELLTRIVGPARPTVVATQAETQNENLDLEMDEEAIIQLVKQLSNADLLQLEQRLPVEFYRQRVSVQQRMNGWRRFLNPLALKIPLLDPDRFLIRTHAALSWLFGPAGFVIWLLVVIYAGVLAGTHWEALTSNFFDRVMGADNLLITLVVFPVIKILHELGHGYAARHWGGEVHEIGIMFLVFMPVPYVDASSVTAFRQRHRRLIVAAAGMLVEVFLAAIAMVLWTMVEPGIIRAVAFNVIFLAGVSTLIFNGNPLLRYDGYYMLSDLLEMPNLGPRANAYIGYLIQRFLFKADVSSPENSSSESAWLIGYGILSFCYRMFVWITIIFFVATRFFFFGVLLAIWGAVLMILRPLFRLFVHLFTATKLAQVRARAVAVSFGFIGLLAFILFLLPLPHTKLSEGIVWMPEGSLVRAKSAGFIVAVEAPMNSMITPGSPLIMMEDPLAVSELKVLKAQKEELEAEYQAMEVADQVRAGVVAEHLKMQDSRLRDAQIRLDGMIVTADASGLFVPVQMGDLLGQYIQKGQVLGYVIGEQSATIKVVVNQQDYLLVRDSFVAIDALFAEHLDKPVALKLLQQVPAASDRLPSRALSQAGGGNFYLDPTDAEGKRALQSHFEFELVVLGPLPTQRSGGRVFVRFDLGAEPIFWRLFRGFRHIFLREFAI
ncbi:MAG: hypothetical protein KUG79_07530 [Pseudomonadales bacterium]|nr:hypothetical protein [Pseudomonadales bacterium]